MPKKNNSWRNNGKKQTDEEESLPAPNTFEEMKFINTWIPSKRMACMKCEKKEASQYLGIEVTSINKEQIRMKTYRKWICEECWNKYQCLIEELLR